ncbi:hypothetical protein [Streptomyces sp. NBC_00063]|uniref:hypothetical protein n=1 Tax=Streptomyces sp. NBC_00063 TaxID=2975638 RepID=UPI00224F58B5|nr:hypothetical protein [Streptomyces sp. NBC_00063]MCX5441239.1 hypothetical protein [Streptomyces sp. NBC_00063]
MSGARNGFGGLIQRGPMAVDVIGSHYTTVFNEAVRDRRLSRRARGLLVELLSHRDATASRSGCSSRLGEWDMVMATLQAVREHLAERTR